MPRPRLPIGQHGTISYTRRGSLWVAHCRMRMNDGTFRQIERSDKSREKARIRLEAHCEHLKARTFGSIDPNTTVDELGAIWLDMKRKAGVSDSTIHNYMLCLDGHIARIGSLALAECTPLILGEFLDSVGRSSGYGAAHTCKSVLGGMFTVATANGAMLHNPVHELRLKRVGGKDSRKSGAIPSGEVRAFLDAVESNELLKCHDEIDLIKVMCACGLRIGEALGLCWDCVDLDERTITIKRIAARVPHVGMKIQEHAKTAASVRTIKTPSWITRLLEFRRLGLESDVIPNPLNLVFPSPLRPGETAYGLRDINRLNLDLSEVRDELGCPGVKITSHTFRKTCASLLHDAGLETLDIADYLGHADTDVTEKVYIARGRNTSKAACALEGLAENAG